MAATTSCAIPAATLADWLTDARRRTLDLVGDLSDAQLMGPRLAIVNPLFWEIGHLAWFHEKWVLRHASGRASLRADADALYDSAAVAHATRWDLPLPSRADTLRYMEQVQKHILDRIDSGQLTADEVYFILLSIFHEDMHTEAFTYTRQTLGYSRPKLIGRPEAQGLQPLGLQGPFPGDAAIPGGTFLLGATPDEPFVFDNEKWSHPVEVRSFAIAKAPVTQAEFAGFVDDGGYQRRELWSADGWRWREAVDARHPLWWQREPTGRWLRRDFDEWIPLEPPRPVLHVNWHEAEAYCRWAGRRLPMEIEWEVAAAASSPDLATAKQRFPWGNEPPDNSRQAGWHALSAAKGVGSAGNQNPTPFEDSERATPIRRANLDGFALGCADVADYPEGDSCHGCRQMLGNVWEWTQSDFLPYPGFVVDPYKEYSQPWFGTHKVLRGGCWVTRGRLLRNTWRNFYPPDRRDVWAGFRTCAVR